MAQPAKHRQYTPEEYFAIEERADYRSEYIDGEIFAMAGATYIHNCIIVNLGFALHAQLTSQGCRVFLSELRVQLSPNRRYVYPDIGIVCGKPEFVKNRTDTITNPIVIIEVLSKSTQDYDRDSKFVAYREIPTLREYILIEQDRVHIEAFVRETKGSWRLQEYDDITRELPFESLHCMIPIQAIYTDIEFPPKPHITRVKERGVEYDNVRQEVSREFKSHVECSEESQLTQIKETGVNYGHDNQ